jgi:hypothetical protein
MNDRFPPRPHQESFLVITKVDGRLHETGTAFPMEHYLKRFDRYEPGDPKQ